MGSEKVRRLLRATQGAEVGDGGKTNYTDFDTAGYQTMAGTARVLKTLWIPAGDFYTDSGSTVGGGQTFTAGSMTTASIGFNVGASILGQVNAGSAMGLKVLTPAANVTGSPTFANAFVRRPLDAATSGSIECLVSWTTVSDNATSGCCYAIKVGMVYLPSGSTPRTAASIITVGSYAAVAAGSHFYESDVGDLPSWGANDVGGILYLMSDQTTASDTGGSNIGFLGVTLRYLSDRLGTQSA